MDGETLISPTFGDASLAEPIDAAIPLSSGRPAVAGLLADPPIDAAILLSSGPGLVRAAAGAGTAPSAGRPFQWTRG